MFILWEEYLKSLQFSNAASSLELLSVTVTMLHMTLPFCLTEILCSSPASPQCRLSTPARGNHRVLSASVTFLVYGWHRDSTFSPALFYLACPPGSAYRYKREDSHVSVKAEHVCLSIGGHLQERVSWLLCTQPHWAQAQLLLTQTLFPLAVFPEVELVGHMVISLLTFLGGLVPHLFSTTAVLSTVYRGPTYHFQHVTFIFL